MGFGGSGEIRRHLCRNSEAKEFTLKDERHPRRYTFKQKSQQFPVGIWRRVRDSNPRAV